MLKNVEEISESVKMIKLSTVERRFGQVDTPVRNVRRHTNAICYSKTSHLKLNQTHLIILIKMDNIIK